MSRTRPTSATVVIVEDHPTYRYALGSLIDDAPGLKLLASFGDGPTGLAGLRQLEPDLALLDLTLPGLDGLRVLGRLFEQGVKTRIVVLSASCASTDAIAALGAGAIGYLCKTVEPDQILSALSAALNGEATLSPDVQTSLVTHLAGTHAAAEVALTPRERDVLTLAAAGLSNARIAKKVFVSTSTVKTHLAQIYEKLGVSGRAAAVAEGVRLRLIDVGRPTGEGGRDRELPSAAIRTG